MTILNDIDFSVTFHSLVSKVIPDVKSIEQLDQNVESVFKGPLPEEAIQLINSLREVYLPRLGL